jgi:hypothetical protein
MAASGLFGRVGEFNSERETFMWKEWRCFFMANGISEIPGEENVAANGVVRERKRAIFLTEIGPESYSTLSNLLVPAKPRDTSLSDIVQALEKHYNPPPLEIAESFHFGTRHQKSGESIGDFIVALKKLSIHCNYGEFLNRALRDRFVCGLNNVKIQNKLLNTEKLTFDRACQIAKSMEMAEKKTQEFHPSTVSESDLSQGTVNKLKAGRENNVEQSCYRCGGRHAAHSCRYKSAKCYKCSKPGHIAPVCRSKVEESGITSKQPQSAKGNIHSAIHSNENDELGIHTLYSVRYKQNKYTVEMFINGCVCRGRYRR